MDYKAMISARRREAINLRENRGQYTLATKFEEDAEAIETLLTERDAAVEFLRIGKSRCNCCMHNESSIHEYPCRDCRDCGGMSDYWQWRGPQKHD